MELSSSWMVKNEGSSVGSALNVVLVQKRAVSWVEAFFSLPGLFQCVCVERKNSAASLFSQSLSLSLSQSSVSLSQSERSRSEAGWLRVVAKPTAWRFGCERPSQWKFKIPKTLPRKCSRENRKWSHCLQPPPSLPCACDFPPSQYPRRHDCM